MMQGIAKLDRKKLIMLGLVLAVGAVLSFWIFSRQKKPAAVKQNPTVGVYMVKRQDMYRHVSLYGETVSDAFIAIAPKYLGRVTDVRVNLGDAVKKGDVLLVQDTVDLDLEIAQNVAASRQAEAEVMETGATYWANMTKVRSDYERKQVNYERYKSLYAQGAIAREMYDGVYQEMVDSKAALDTLENQVMEQNEPANIEIKRAALAKSLHATEALRKQREDRILRAPRDGVIAYRNAEVGQLAIVGQKLFELVDNSRLYIDCNLSEQDVATLTLGMKVKLTVESLGREYLGRISFVSPAMSSDTRSFRVRIELTDKDEVLKAGMFARARVGILQRKNTLFVPKTAVAERMASAMCLFSVRTIQ